jgi:hypothetical protein
MGSNFSIKIDGNSTIGAVAFGPGAKAEGSVTIGGQPKPSHVRFKASIDVRGATSRGNLAAALEAAALSIRSGQDIGAIGNVTGATPSGVAWKVEQDT